MGFIGSVESPQLLADIVLWPQRSIIKQSYDARERKGDPNLPFHLAHGSLNGDGCVQWRMRGSTNHYHIHRHALGVRVECGCRFGIGWFSPEERRAVDPAPCVFTSVTPAW